MQLRTLRATPTLEPWSLATLEVWGSTRSLSSSINNYTIAHSSVLVLDHQIEELSIERQASARQKFTFSDLLTRVVMKISIALTALAWATHCNGEITGSAQQTLRLQHSQHDIVEA
jgi:hypothetical protein